MRTILLLFFIGFISSLQAQQQLAPDQNPNYLISQQKYTGIKDSLQSTMNTTVQQTYKAYDWYQAKLERKQNRIENRNVRRLYRSYNDYSYFNNDRFNNRWNNGFNNWNNRRFFPSSIGYRTGNWWFWF
jgi:hypothetical protein